MVDYYELSPVYGANMVLVSEDVQTVCVNLFRQGEFRPVYVEPNKPSGEDLSPFQLEIQARISRTEKTWENFTREVQGALAVRAGHLRRRIFARA